MRPTTLFATVCLLFAVGCGGPPDAGREPQRISDMPQDPNRPIDQVGKAQLAPGQVGTSPRPTEMVSQLIGSWHGKLLVGPTTTPDAKAAFEKKLSAAGGLVLELRDGGVFRCNLELPPFEGKWTLEGSNLRLVPSRATDWEGALGRIEIDPTGKKLSTPMFVHGGETTIEGKLEFVRE